jgi:hypothetical protein
VVVSPPPASRAVARPRPGAQTRKHAKVKKSVETKKAKPDPVRPIKQTLPAAKRAAEKASSSPNSLLLIGGLALVVLVLGDTVFLSLSTRFLRET